MTGTRPFSRHQIIARLRQQIAQGKPIVGAGSSSGLIARAAAAGGADLIIVYNTGTSRLMGLPTTHTMNHANPSTLAMYDEIANVVTDTPIVGGGEAQDPTFLDLRRLVKAFRETGYDGMINFPTSGPSAERNRDRASVDLGVERDFETVRIAREQDYFTICYGYTEEQTRGLAAAGADAIVAHAGWTTGGLAGAGASAMSLDQACQHVQKMLDIARAENPEVILLAHGGPISSAEDTRYLYEHTDAQGFLGASSMERIPVEGAIIEAVKAFKSKRPRARQSVDQQVAAVSR